MPNTNSPVANPPVTPFSSVVQFLAEKVTQLNYVDLPPASISWAKVGILDTVGVTLAGMMEPCAQILMDTIGSSNGNALIFGTKLRTNSLDAALINGTASHALDFDDCNNTMGGHPSVPILPALFALASETKVSGETFITAYIAGFEVETKIAMMVNFHHYMKGWHPTATLGVFGSAAACSKLLGLNQEQTATALAIAASSAAGIKANFGTMTKPFHIGRCAREGLLAAKLAQKGFTANSKNVFEHAQGFLEVFNGVGNYDIHKGLNAWAAPWDIMAPGIAIKQYPCCGSTHPAIDSAIDIYQQTPFNVEEIESIAIHIHERRLKHTNRPSPGTELDAKFSVQYVVARALLSGCVGLEHFENNAFAAPEVLTLLSKIKATPYDATQFDPSNHFGGIVRVHLKNGKTFSAQVDQPLGRTSENPLPMDRLEKKFELCAVRAIDADAIKKALEQIQDFQHLQDVGDLMRFL